VQYIVLRKDLWGDLGWPLGPVIAQACHASTAATMQYVATDQVTQQYIATENLDHMHKVSIPQHGEGGSLIAERPQSS